MKIILWVHITHLDRLQQCIQQWESTSSLLEGEPIKMSKDQIGHQWLMVVLGYDTFTALHDNNVIRIY